MLHGQHVFAPNPDKIGRNGKDPLGFSPPEHPLTVEKAQSLAPVPPRLSCREANSTVFLSLSSVRRMGWAEADLQKRPLTWRIVQFSRVARLQSAA